MGYSLSSELMAGVDEAGRGPLAGPVVAAAVILDGKRPVAVKDSKSLTAAQRLKAYHEIKKNCMVCAVGIATVEEIEQLNILQASLKAMQRAIEQLAFKPSRVLVDGCHKPKTDIPTEAIIAGDQTISAISAASIVAKVVRDHMMLVYDLHFPEYGFAAHKGYGTRYHQEQLKRLGPCLIHRRSFAPIKSLL